MVLGGGWAVDWRWTGRGEGARLRGRRCSGQLNGGVKDCGGGRYSAVDIMG